MISQQLTYYEILNVPSTATQDQIKSAYKLKLLSTHPDKKSAKADTSNHRSTSSSTHPDINQILTAYTTLSSPQLRSQYDSDLQTQSKINGVNLSGDGLDSFTLDDFECIEAEVNSGENEVQFVRVCPRCQYEQGMVLTEDDLISKGTNCDDDEGRFDIIVQCNSCSLWIHVRYYEETE
ncbi:DPH4 [Candida metapsilosis]|uniref:Diphthamide biosynthesis protein 4 n=1 Tax=Candida metapsilosis TaxID=273372 RepID=A0A8H7ZE66_9ASCO|nr:DPH4 [Candida metapsilosis]